MGRLYLEVERHEIDDGDDEVHREVAACETTDWLDEVNCLNSDHLSPLYRFPLATVWYGCGGMPQSPL
jgi:hypothetical protein